MVFVIVNGKSILDLVDMTLFPWLIVTNTVGVFNKSIK